LLDTVVHSDELNLTPLAMQSDLNREAKTTNI
jgi:hypothetical protein